MLFPHQTTIISLLIYGVAFSARSTPPTRALPTHPDKNAVAAHARGHLGDFGPYRILFPINCHFSFLGFLLYSESILRLLKSVCFSLLYFMFISQYNVQNLYKKTSLLYLNHYPVLFSNPSRVPSNLILLSLFTLSFSTSRSRSPTVPAPLGPLSPDRHELAGSPLSPTFFAPHISDELKEMALSMSLQGLHDSDIREYTGISEQLLKRFRSTHRRRLGRR